MAKRFEYKRMTGQELTEALGAIEMKPEAFARIYGLPTDRLRKWMADQQDIPPWVPIVCAMMVAGHSGEPILTAMRIEAGERILHDREMPERGDFPYRRDEE